MWKIGTLSLALIGLTGCSRSDVATLGRIGAKVHNRLEVVWKSEPNRRLLTTLPLLQPPAHGGAPAAAEENKAVPPRLTID